MSTKFILQLEISSNGSDFTSLSFQNGSASYVEKSTYAEHGEQFVTTIDWLDTSVNTPQQRVALYRKIRQASHLRIWCTGGVFYELTAEQTPDVSYDMSVGDSAGSFNGFEWQYQLIHLKAAEMSFY